MPQEDRTPADDVIDDVIVPWLVDHAPRVNILTESAKDDMRERLKRHPAVADRTL